MPQSFSVPSPWGDEGWKFKIRDRERVEPPHVSVLYKTKCWRFGLRERDFLDGEPPAREVPKELVKDLKARVGELEKAWNAIYPENPVNSGEDHNE